MGRQRGGEEDGGYRQKCQPPRTCHAEAFEVVPSRGADAQGGATERNPNPMRPHHNEVFKAASSRGTDAQGEDKCAPRQGVRGGTLKRWKGKDEVRVRFNLPNSSKLRRSSHLLESSCVITEYSVLHTWLETETVPPSD
jgi:hypothetical protein